MRDASTKRRFLNCSLSIYNQFLSAIISKFAVVTSILNFVRRNLFATSSGWCLFNLNTRFLGHVSSAAS